MTKMKQDEGESFGESGLAATTHFLQQQNVLAWSAVAELISAITTLPLSPSVSFSIVDNLLTTKQRLFLFLHQNDLGCLAFGWAFGMVEQFFSQRLAQQFESHFEEYKTLQKRKHKELWEELEKKKKRKRKETRQNRYLKERDLSVWVEEHFGVALVELYDGLTIIEHTLSLLEDILLRGSSNATTTTTTTTTTITTATVTTMPVHHRLEALCHSILFSTPVFREILYHYFSKQFHDFCQSTLSSPGRMEEEEEDTEEEREREEERGRRGESGREGSLLLLSKLGRLGVIGGSEEVFTEILFDEIEATISRHCRGRFDRSCLLDILHYLDSSVFAWLKLVILSSPHNNNNMTTYLQWKTRLEFFVYETFADLRISELFDIIVDFPESTAALEDLLRCLNKTHQHPELVRSLHSMFQKRLLHPGAQTSDIITQYILTIKALHLLDPSGILLESVSNCIKDYLREREDTIRSVVTALTEDSNADLLGANTSQTHDTLTNNNNGDTRKRRKLDILMMLVNIYGTKELFVNEYRSLLSNRLLSLTDYETEKELLTLELLTLRFGEGTPALHNCEIMLKDISDSKRINNHIHRTTTTTTSSSKTTIIPSNFNATLISNLFWPPIKDEPLKLPPQIECAMEGYQKEFTAHKDMRKLEWKKSLGLVQLELEFQDGRKLELNVAPIHASIISCFSSPEGGMPDEILTAPTTKTWTSSELAEKVGVSVEVLRKRVSFWKTQNVLRETQKDVFEVIEVLLDNEADSHHSHKPGRSGLGGDDEAEEESDDDEEEGEGEEEDQEEGRGSKKDKKKQRQKQKGSGSGESEELWATCEKFVVAMLTNLGVLQLERIQGMLTQFVESYNQTIHQLKSHLNQMVNEDRLELIQSNSSSNNPSYSLKK